MQASRLSSEHCMAARFSSFIFRSATPRFFSAFWSTVNLWRRRNSLAICSKLVNLPSRGSYLDSVYSRSRSKIVHASLETLLPRVEMHGCQFTIGRFGHEKVERLRLINKGATIGSHVNDNPLWQFPNSLVQFLEILWDIRDLLNASIMSNDHVFDVVVPQTSFNQIFKQMLVLQADER